MARWIILNTFWVKYRCAICCCCFEWWFRKDTDQKSLEAITFSNRQILSFQWSSTWWQQKRIVPAYIGYPIVIYLWIVEMTRSRWIKKTSNDKLPIFDIKRWYKIAKKGKITSQFLHDWPRFFCANKIHALMNSNTKITTLIRTSSTTHFSAFKHFIEIR